MKLVKFIDTDSMDLIYINPDHVRYLVPNGIDETIVCMQSESSTVNGSVDEVAGKLQGEK